MGTLSVSGPWSKHRLSLRLFFNWRNKTEITTGENEAREKVKMKKGSPVMTKLEGCGFYHLNIRKAIRKWRWTTLIHTSHQICSNVK